MTAYAKLRAEIEAKRSLGQTVDMTSLNQELEDRFASIIDSGNSEDAGSDEEPPPVPAVDGSMSVDRSVLAALEKMQLAQRQTDMQLEMITKQLKELTTVVSRIRSV